MPIEDPLEAATLLPHSSGSSAARATVAANNALALGGWFVVSWRIILLVVLAVGIALVTMDRTLLSYAVSPDVEDTAVNFMRPPSPNCCLR